MTDFPPISKEENPEVLYQFIYAHFKNTGEIISYASIPDKMGGGPLKVKGKRTKISEDVAAPKPKRTKVPKAEASKASNTASDSEEVIQKKRTEKPEVQDAAREAALREKEAVKEATEEWVNEEEEEDVLEPKKKKEKQSKEIVSPMMVVTPEMAQMAKEYADNAIAKKKQLKQQYILERDEKLKAAGMVEINPLSAEKDAEILALTAEVEDQTMKEATDLLQGALKGKGISEAAGSEAHHSGNTSDQKAYVNTQTLPSSPSLSSSTTESDFDFIPLNQKIRKPRRISKTSSFEPSNVDEVQIGLSQRRIEIYKKLPADHFFQPPIIEALNMIPANASAEPTSSQIPSSNKPQPSSPSTLFSLEKHFGGEMSKTPQKASETVPEKTVLENQQPPRSVIEEEPEVHVELQNQTQNNSKTQPEIQPEIIINQQTQNETANEQHQAPELSSKLNQHTNSDKSSSSSQTIIIQQPLPNILESECIDNELLRIRDEVKELILLRKVPILSIHYEDQWMNLKKNVAELLDKISQKCLRTQAIVLKRHLAAIHRAEKAKGPLLCLANAPFFSESEYVTREDKLFQQLKQKLLSTQAEAQAKENEFQKMK
ncbi:hypothetical protein MtrunA17_Chr4g0021661 [Medicago truncatula]|uniref:Uncharacterized protein n=1 Tax=Medicago truncatula TaxID=3880 RepID=A0A396IB91_MEDTR|nr:hypothetical protein MtrunA17_Chr4g0021661 [Medicago truncatula]